MFEAHLIAYILARFAPRSIEKKTFVQLHPSSPQAWLAPQARGTFGSARHFASRSPAIAILDQVQLEVVSDRVRPPPPFSAPALTTFAPLASCQTYFIVLH